MKTIAIIMPSRGLPYARTIIWLEKQREKYPVKLYMSHDLPIPQCFNKLINEALKHDHDYFFFLEEDIVPPKDAISNLLKVINSEHDCGIAIIDYPFRGGLDMVSRSNVDGEIISCGTGCTMVKRAVFKSLSKPYFRSDWKYQYLNHRWYKTNPNKVYGLHDMWFAWKTIHAGYRICLAKGECVHLGVTALGKQNTNNGCHQIDERPKISVKLISVDPY